MRIRNGLSICTALLLVSLIAAPALAQENQLKQPSPGMSLVPMRQEQLVYSLNVFDGKGWSSTFCPQSENTIYMVANQDSAITAKKTLVYYWPITDKYMAGWKTLNQDIEGTLEVLHNGEVIHKLEKKDTVVYYPQGYWGEETVFYSAEKARQEYQRYKKAENAYYEALNKYQEAQSKYREELNKFFEQVKKRREAGEKGALDVEIPEKPQPPEGPSFYVTKPNKNYVVNLPPGRYKIRLRAKDETIVEGSEKYIRTFTARRKGGVGYKIIPGNRWTKKEECNDPAKVIYAAGKNLLYFRPYYQNEYNDLYYSKLQDPQNQGREESWRWVHTEPIKDLLLLFYGEERLLDKVEEKPYKVKQVSGAELGYNIVEFKEEEKQSPRDKPTFTGYLVTLTEDLPKQGYNVYLQKKNEGKVIPESERGIRLVKKKNIDFLYYLSIFPLIIGGIMFAIRRRKVKK